MQVPPEEIQRYDNFAVQIALKLRAVEISGELLLWHYTSGPGLLGILKSQTLYSTHVSCLNDSSEIRYASQIFRQALTRLLEPRVKDDATAKFLVEALNYFDEDPLVPNHVALPYFVGCFSEVRDDLTQWRAYGGGENGYALGFRAKDLFGTPSSYLARVTYYDHHVHQPIVDEVAAATLSFFMEGLQQFGAEDSIAWTAAFLERWDIAITQVAPLIKHAAFRGESEIRICRTCRIEDLKDFVFLQKNSMLTRHLPLRLGEPRDGNYRLPISEIMIGPCRHPHVSRTSVGTLLQQLGYNEVPVRLSATPFQMT